MNIELCALCDAATDYAGRVNILGITDTLVCHELPFVYPGLTLVIRFRFKQESVGAHPVEVRFMNQEKQLLVPPLKADLNMQLAPDQDQRVGNLMLNVQGIRFVEAGMHHVEILMDGVVVQTLPLNIMYVPNPRIPKSEL